MQGVNEVRLNWLVNRRTRDLKVTIAEKEAIASREAAMAKRINRMERNTIRCIDVFHDRS